ncbi:MAG: hypothetical protein QOF38_184, partial [Pseudonocardiales bacterium]|nr:hypothetical protein [Pseudonocardiales bacterium]
MSSSTGASGPLERTVIARAPAGASRIRYRILTLAFIGLSL